MLDLTMRDAHSQNLSQLDAKPPEEGCFYFTLSADGMG
jgi:hypothetical protein